MDAYRYPNGFNTSQHEVCDGNVTSTITGGVTPYTYHWNPGNQTTASPTNLCPRENILEVTDNNGCRVNQPTVLSTPERDVWAMEGNNNSDPASQFIGTIDNKDLSLRTYNQERLNIKADGTLQINSLGGSNAGMLYTDPDGYLWSSSNTIQPICTPPTVWKTITTPSTIYSCPGTKIGLGISNIPSNISFMVAGTTQFNGSVGIGTDPTINNASSYKLVVGGKFGANEAWVSIGTPWPDYIFGKNYKLKSFDELNSFISKENHLPGMPSANEITDNGKINLGDTQIKQQEKIEEAYLYILELKKEIDLLKKKVSSLETKANK